MFKPSLFFVDDEPNILSSVKRLFHGAPVALSCFPDGKSALEALSTAPPAAIVSDYRMPGMDGIELLERCREASPNTVRLLLTGFVDMEAAIGAINRGSVYRFLRKPWEAEELRGTVLAAIAESISSKATIALSEYLGSLIGVDSRDGAIEALRLFLGEPSSLGIEDIGFDDPAAGAASTAADDGGLSFNCPLGDRAIRVGIEAEEVRVFKEAGLEQRLGSLVETALRGCRLAVESAKARGRLIELSERDPLSGLYNRRAMAAKVDAECSRRDRYGTFFSVLLMDVDSFKTINDRYGHAKGDAVIAGIGELISSCCRNVDIPSRRGGDEFLVALPSTPAENALVLAKRIQALASELGTELGLEARLTLSIGMAAAPIGTKGIEALIAAADASMYEVKRSGKDGVGAPTSSAP
jgi:two-component system cell cycle response regulator